MAPFGHAGIAGSSAAVSVINTIVGYFWLKRKHGISFLQWRNFLGKVALTLSLTLFLFLSKEYLFQGWLWMLLANALFLLLFERLNRKLWRSVFFKVKGFFQSPF